MKGHWAPTCHMRKHLADLYQASLKEKGRGAETNFVHHPMDFTHMDVSDFFENSEGKINNLTENGNDFDD